MAVSEEPAGANGCFLGVDGGGSKTAFVLVDPTGRELARHEGGSSYHVQIGVERLHELLNNGVHAVLRQAGVSAGDVRYAFFGLPAHGEDSQVQPVLDVIPEAVLGHRRYACGNDMICGWAGSLAGEDGINIVAGTGSIGYGERGGLKARGGGWGEVFSDEGSAYWIAVQGLNLFSRMSDGRAETGPLHALLVEAFELEDDLDLCARIYAREGAQRDRIAAVSRLVAKAAMQGDAGARDIFLQAGRRLAEITDAIRRRLCYAPGEAVMLSYSGGVFQSGELILAPFRETLAAFSPDYRIVEPRFSPAVGAAIYAARLAGFALPLT
ncbi:BadF/BadG/BcrA/BcrD ATPase family protein [Brevundimonas sp. SH203]|uniref:N-acetylglucosamine kinase n=1 Tax=Brevundimonas sp. SH203 TaxID=345167 RepID=UPI0009D32DC3|nr:BadF/BadG/BcrA/BcrD ATPase family protein [Brevundimonas sp. SH203]GAW41069.1 BadF/BadG/BcrA/BcrD ATPase family protein [Brevundimonas sp. SH203]